MPRVAIALSILVCLVSTTAFGALDIPSSKTAQAEGPSGAVVHFTVSVIGGNDGSDGRPADTVTCSPASGSLFPIGTTTVSCSGSEGSTGSFPVIVIDTIAPALTIPRDFTVVTTSTSGESVTYNASAVDLVDGSVAVACTPPSGSTFAVGTTPVTCTATDSRSNTASETFNITVTLTTPPPGNPDIVAEATGPDGARVSFNIDGGEDSDGRPSSGCSPASGSLFAIGDTTIVCPSGNFIISVVDTTGPALNLPAMINATATSAAGAVVTYDASATDVVDGSVAITCTPPSGSTFAIGTTTVECSASDSRGNNSTGSFDVVVSVGNIPIDLTVEATGPGGAAVTFNFTNCSPASGTTFPLGATLVTCSEGTFTITVVDTTDPDLTLPANITAEATSASGAVVTYTATATDIVDGSVPVVCEVPSGSTFPIGTTYVPCSATDANGNSAGGTFTVTVTDTTPPDIISVTVNPSTIWPPNKKMVDVTVTVQVQDAVDPAPLVRIYSITCDETIAASDTALTGNLTAQLRADRAANGDGRVYTLHIEAIDGFGNRSTATVTVTVPHDQSGAVTITPPTKRRSVGGR